MKSLFQQPLILLDHLCEPTEMRVKSPFQYPTDRTKFGAQKVKSIYLELP
jgi:hypothetical protein